MLITFLTKQLVMTIGVTANDWTLTKEMVESSLDSFANAPIVWNKRSKFKEYNTNNTDEVYFNQCEVIGMICETPNVIIEENNVYADIIIYGSNTHIWKGKFDNWCLQFGDTRDSFKLFSIEVF